MLTPQLIPKFDTGLYLDETPYIAPPDAFVELDNFHVRHGYVEKRNGSRLYGYMVHSNANGDSSISVTNITVSMNEGDPATVTTLAPHLLSNGDQVVFNNVEGMTEINFIRYTISAAVGDTFQIVDTFGFSPFVTGTGTAIVNLAPSNPITGIYRYLKSNNDYELIVFDNKRAARYEITSHTFVGINRSNFLALGQNIFNSGTTDYVWAWQWQSQVSLLNRLYFTNGLPIVSSPGSIVNGIMYYDGITIYTIEPDLAPTGTSRKLLGGKLIFTLAQRLLIFNTYEGVENAEKSYPQRCRYSQSQNPDSWREVAGGGGFLDAPTGDHIVSARALKDSIIVFFTDSVWVLRYSIGDPSAPFRWYKLNDFRACGGKMASVGYDQYVIAVGKRGITSTDYTQTTRIDDKISDFVTDNINSADFGKVVCARSYGKQRWWTLYPKQTSDEDSENKGVLIYDDDSGAYSTYGFPLNIIGTANVEYDYGLDDFTAENGLDFILLQVGDETINSNAWQFDGDILTGGDITGGIYLLESSATDAGESISSSFKTVYWSPFKEEGREAQMSYIDLYLDSQYDTLAKIEFFKNDEFDPYQTQYIDMLPDLSYVVEIDDVVTDGTDTIINATGHGLTTSQTIFIYLVNGMIELNDRAFTITVIDDDSFLLDDIDSTDYTPYETGGNIYLRQYYATQVWKRAFAGGIGYQHAIRVSTSGANTPMRLYSLKPYFKPRGKRTIN